MIDAEIADQAPPPALAGRFGAHDFWGRWTRTEVAAKVADVPVAIWLHDHGLDSDIVVPVRSVRIAVDSATVVVSAAYPRHLSRRR